MLVGCWIRGRWICVFGAPRFSAQRLQNPCFEGFWSDLEQQIWGAQNADPTTTDPMPHSRPSEERPTASKKDQTISEKDLPLLISQKTGLWLFPGSVRGFPRKTPGKSRENCWKTFPESRNATDPRISGTGKGKPDVNLGSTLPLRIYHSNFLDYTSPFYFSEDELV